MTMCSKVYAVVEFGGMYDSSWNHIIGICSTSELADELKACIEEKHNPVNSVIDKDTWYNIIEKLCNAEESGYEYDNMISGILELFPEYSKKDIEKAIELYDNDDWAGVTIQEIDFYTKLSDITDGN